MSDRAILLQQVLAWSNSLMAVRSLDQLAARLAQPPAAETLNPPLLRQGTAYADALSGTAGADFLNGMAGNDTRDVA